MNLINIKNSLLYALINYFIYIKLLKKTIIEINKNIRYKLHKFLYSFKQLPYL